MRSTRKILFTVAEERPLSRRATVQASMSVALSLSRVSAPRGCEMTWDASRDRWSVFVVSLRGDASREVLHHCEAHSATVRLASLTGAPESRRARVATLCIWVGRRGTVRLSRGTTWLLKWVSERHIHAHDLVR